MAYFHKGIVKQNSAANHHHPLLTSISWPYWTWCSLRHPPRASEAAVAVTTACQRSPRCWDQALSKEMGTISIQGVEPLTKKPIRCFFQIKNQQHTLQGHLAWAKKTKDDLGSQLCKLTTKSQANL